MTPNGIVFVARLTVPSDFVTIAAIEYPKNEVEPGDAPNGGRAELNAGGGNYD